MDCGGGGGGNYHGLLGGGFGQRYALDRFRLMANLPNWLGFHRFWNGLAPYLAHRNRCLWQRSRQYIRIRFLWNGQQADHYRCRFNVALCFEQLHDQERCSNVRYNHHRQALPDWP